MTQPTLSTNRPQNSPSARTTCLIVSHKCRISVAQVSRKCRIVSHECRVVSAKIGPLSYEVAAKYPQCDTFAKISRRRRPPEAPGRKDRRVAPVNQEVYRQGCAYELAERRLLTLDDKLTRARPKSLRSVRSRARTVVTESRHLLHKLPTNLGRVPDSDNPALDDTEPLCYGLSMTQPASLHNQPAELPKRPDGPVGKCQIVSDKCQITVG